ncbi:GrpB family protein [Paenibacillus ferrarius]|uniref:GrpB family protein n=1 Tax=Paenibacillus ferrarius TaxID=1469647 RepID=UPI003D2CFCDC
MHIYVYGSEEWNNNIFFRDYLKTHPEMLKQYNQLKKNLQKSIPTTGVCITTFQNRSRTR